MNKRKRGPRKPTGLGGSLVFGGGREAEFRQTLWPGTKREIEEMVVTRSFMASGVRGPDLRELYRLIAEPQMNPDENGFDVILATASGEQYLELTEAAPLRVAGGSYAKAPTGYRVGDLADRVFAELLEKSDGYGPSPRSVIHLLVYSTDFRFRLGHEVLDLLGFRSLRGELCFASIVYYDAHDEDDDHLVLVHPRSMNDLHGFDEVSARGRQIMLGDLTTVEAIPNGVVVKLGAPPAVLGPGPVTLTIRHRIAPADSGQRPGKQIPKRPPGTP